MRQIAVAACLCWVMAVGPAAAQTHPVSLATLFEDVYGPERPGAEQRRRAARRHEPRGALQQRVPVGFSSRQHRAHEPADRRPAAVARIRFHLPLRPGDRHLRAIDEQLRADPLRPRRDHRPGPDGIWVHATSSSRSIISTACRSPTFRRSFAMTTFRPAAAAPMSSRRRTPSRRRSASSPAR